MNALGDDLTHVINLCERLHVGGLKIGKRAEVLRKRQRGRLTHMPASERENEAGERRVLRLPDAFKQVRSGLRPHALDGLLKILRRRCRRDEILRLEREDVGRTLHQPFVHKHVDDLLTEPVDAHGPAGGKVNEGELHLRRTVQTARASRVLLLLVADRGRPTDRADGRHCKRHGTLWTALVHDAHHLGNHVPRPADHDRVTGAQIKARNMVLVVKSGVRDGHAADENGLQARDRRELARAPDLNVDGFADRQSLFGRVLVGAGPAGLASNEAELPLKLKAVHLVDDAVDVEGQRVPDLRHLIMKGRERCRPLDPSASVRNRESERRKSVENFRLRGREFAARDFTQRIGVKMKRPACGHCRIELAQGPRRRISRIDEGLLPLLCLTAVERLEVVAMHDHLAAHLQHVGEVALQTKRDRADRARIRGHVLPCTAVAASGGLYENALFITKIRCQTVKLELAVVRHGRILIREPEFAAHAAVECRRTLARKVGLGVNGKHRHGVHDLCKVASNSTAHAGRGRGRTLPFRKSGLKSLELIERAVVFGVGNARIVKHEVLVVPGLYELLELTHAGGGPGGLDRRSLCGTVEVVVREGFSLCRFGHILHSEEAKKKSPPPGGLRPNAAGSE